MFGLRCRPLILAVVGLAALLAALLVVQQRWLAYANVPAEQRYSGRYSDRSLREKFIEPLSVKSSESSKLSGRSAASEQSAAADSPAFYKRVFALLERGEWVQARRLAARGASPLIAKLVDWLDLRRSNSGRSFAEISAFLQANPEWPEPTLLARRAEEAMTVAIADEQVLAWFADRTPLTTDGDIRLIKALQNVGRTQESDALVRQTWIERNFGPKQEQYFLQDHRERLQPEDHWQRLDRLLWEGRAHAARRVMPFVDTAHQALAEARIAVRRYQFGIDLAIAKVPGTLLDHPGLVYERLSWRRRNGRYDEAIELLKTIKQPLPFSRYWWYEINYLAREALQRGNIKLAYRLSARYGQTESEEIAEAEWFAGWLALRFLARPRDALNHFTRAYERTAETRLRARSAYWAGRAAEALKFSPQAYHWYRLAAVYQETYYGQLAAGQLERPGVRYLSEPQASPDDVQRFEKHELVKMVRELSRLGKTEYAQEFVMRLGELSSDATRLYLVARLAVDADRLSWVARLGVNLSRQGFTVHNVAYPLLPEVQHMDAPEAALVLAIIHQESLFDPAAKSHAGARGLMQLMPDTARHIAAELNLSFNLDQLITSSAYNVRLGGAYIAKLIDAWDGSYLLAIASYNAGPGRVQSWIAEFGDPREADVDSIDWIERIPFAETRAYVQHVMEGLMVYRSRLGYPFAMDLRRDLERSQRVQVRF